MDFFLESRSLTVHFESGEDRQRAIQVMAYLTVTDLGYPAGDDSFVVIDLKDGIDPLAATSMIRGAAGGGRVGTVDVSVDERYL